MLAFVRGKVQSIADDHLVVDTGSLGYIISTSEDELRELKIGDEVMLHSYFHVREDRQELYGFRAEDKLALFKLLISVSGVGPKVALGILANKPDAIKQAISGNKPAYLATLPGIGKKTAKKIVMELQDKVGEYWVSGDGYREENGDEDVIKALMELGFGRADAQKAAQEVDSELSLEEKVKAALK